MDVKALLASLNALGELSESDAESAFEALLTGQMDEAQVAALLAMIQARPGGTTVDELVGAARVMRRHVTPVPFTPGEGEALVDTCGTGGAAKTFNVSTAAAIVAAASETDPAVAGVRRVLVAKHGNRSRTGRGSAEVLAALGVNVDASPQTQARCLREAGVCFCFAIHHHPAMRHAAGPRRSLGFPTIFNLLGPLTNPADARRQVIGVYHPALVDKLARALARLGAQRAIVAHGDGLDELTTTGGTWIGVVEDGQAAVDRIDSAAMGLPRATRDELVARDVEHAAAMVRAAIAPATAFPVAQGGGGALTDIVALNAAAALVVASAASDLVHGLSLAKAAIASGRALQTLERLVAASHQP